MSANEKLQSNETIPEIMSSISDLKNLLVALTKVPVEKVMQIFK